MIEAKWAEGKFVCVGLDSDFEKIPDPRVGGVTATILGFNRQIVEATRDLVCAYKPNIAFYEAYGDAGWLALRETVVYIRRVAPEVPVILDAKRADIGNTNNGYVQNIFGFLDVDAVTVNPYLGAAALFPFLDCKNKGIFILCRTSNPGSYEFQDLEVRRYNYLSHLHPEDDKWTPLFIDVARRVAGFWNNNGNCGLVVGAIYPKELSEVRELVGDMPILIPGIGAQGGDIEATVQAGKDSRGRGVIINSSRGIIFASSGPDFAEAARRETLKLHQAITACLQKGVSQC
ncbi:MAG: orotidine-5'-phosphate decarboxylase [Patescibacteria group bacterium]